MATEKNHATETINSSKKRRRKRRVGLIYDDRMCKHNTPTQDEEEDHPECPNRIRAIWDLLQSSGIAQRCVVLDGKVAADNHLALVHTKKHVDLIKAVSSKTPESKRNKIANRFDSVYFNEGSSEAALLAAGSVLEVTEKVAKGELDSAFAIVRPPGHHAEEDEPMGFCLYNNVAVAASFLLNERLELGIKKILIVDWDVHHGNGTQNMFYDDPRVLVFSVHRHESGTFYPGGDDGSYIMTGEGPGAGYNINVPWENGRCGDADYLAVWDHILLPVANEFGPDIVIVAAGFDAAKGDPLGGCLVSPYGYSAMLHALIKFAKGKIVLALEGGYNVNSIAESAKACVEVLLKHKPVKGSVEAYPFESTWRVIQDVRRELSAYWPTLAMALPDSVIIKEVNGDVQEATMGTIMTRGHKKARLEDGKGVIAAEGDQSWHVRMGLSKTNQMKIPVAQTNVVDDEDRVVPRSSTNDGEAGPSPSDPKLWKTKEAFQSRKDEKRAQLDLEDYLVMEEQLKQTRALLKHNDSEFSRQLEVERKKQVDEAIARDQAYAAEIAKFESRVGALEAQIGALEAQVVEVHADHATLHTQNAELKLNLEDYLVMEEQLKQTRALLKHKDSEFSCQLEVERKKQVDEAIARDQAYAAVIAKFENQFGAWEAQVEKVRADHATLHTQNAELDKKWRLAESELKSSKANVKDLRECLKAIDRELSQSGHVLIKDAVVAFLKSSAFRIIRSGIELEACRKGYQLALDKLKFMGRLIDGEPPIAINQFSLDEQWSNANRIAMAIDPTLPSSFKEFIGLDLDKLEEAFPGTTVDFGSESLFPIATSVLSRLGLHNQAPIPPSQINLQAVGTSTEK